MSFERRGADGVRSVSGAADPVEVLERLSDQLVDELVGLAPELVARIKEEIGEEVEPGSFMAGAYLGTAGGIGLSPQRLLAQSPDSLRKLIREARKGDSHGEVHH